MRMMMMNIFSVPSLSGRCWKKHEALMRTRGNCPGAYGHAGRVKQHSRKKRNVGLECFPTLQGKYSPMYSLM